MVKEDLVRRVMEAQGLRREVAVQAVERILDVLRETVARHGRVELRGFGVFTVRKRKRGVGRNPKRPETSVAIPEGYVVRFKPGKEFKAE